MYKWSYFSHPTYIAIHSTWRIIPGIVSAWDRLPFISHEKPTIAVDTNSASRVRNLPTRYLPPGSLRMLHEQMKVDLLENNGISYMHFWRTFGQHWTGVLRFLPPSTHGTCDTCNNFKGLFKKTPVSDPQGHFEAAKAYRDHVTSVSRDRDLEEYLQAQNPLMRQDAPLAP